MAADRALRPTALPARLLREASSSRGHTRADLAQAARHRDPSWRVPDDGTIANATRRLKRDGFLRITVASRGGEEVVYRLTPTGSAEVARLFPNP